MGTTTNTVEAVLNVKPNTVASWLAKGKAVGSSTTSNASMFSSIASILAQLVSDTTALDTAQFAAANRGKDEIQARNARWANAQRKDLRAARASVQGLCDAAPDAEHAADDRRRRGARRQGEAGPHQGARSPASALGNGVVKLTVKVLGKKGARVYYEWRMSTDGGVTWTSLPGTNVSSTAVHCLTPGLRRSSSLPAPPSMNVRLRLGRWRSASSSELDGNGPASPVPGARGGSGVRARGDVPRALPPRPTGPPPRTSPTRSCAASRRCG